MLPKLFIIILIAGATAAALLVNRQHRIDAAHEISTLHQRLLQREQALWRMRVEIAERVRPEQVREQMRRSGGTWVSIPEKPGSRPIEQLRLALADAARLASEHEWIEERDLVEERTGG